MPKQFRFIILLVSVLIPLLVAFLYFIPKTDLLKVNLNFLPLVNAIINGTTSVLIILAVLSVKKGNKNLHKRIMLTALFLSVCFLVSYVLYHSTHESTKFGGQGFIKYVYYFILLTHILLSVIIVPLVLITLSRALAEKFDKHKKIARITFPLWLYVTVSGVLVYLLISPYY
jgi:putative membrane protein